MKPEEQRIAIAEACGWTRLDESWSQEVRKSHMGVPGKDLIASPPDYLNDLNAMHEAEKVLTPAQATRYRSHLYRNSDGPDAEFQTFEAAMCHATAVQRAEAFLKTLNLWTTQPAKGPK